MLRALFIKSEYQQFCDAQCELNQNSKDPVMKRQSNVFLLLRDTFLIKPVKIKQISRQFVLVELQMESVNLKIKHQCQSFGNHQGIYQTSSDLHEASFPRFYRTSVKRCFLQSQELNIATKTDLVKRVEAGNVINCPQ